MKAMKDFPSVIRTEYVYALLYEENENKAVKVKFEKQAKMYPYENEIQAEREFMKISKRMLYTV